MEMTIYNNNNKPTLEIISTKPTTLLIEKQNISEITIDNTQPQINTIDFLDRVLTNTLTEYSNPSVTSIKGYVFRECTKLEKVNLPNIISIGTQSFHTCTNLMSISFPKLTTLNTYAFTGCTKLTSINFPILTYLQVGSLQNCSALTKLDFPKVNNIDNFAVAGCSSLTTFILRNNAVAKLNNSKAFENTPIANGTGYIYVPDVLVDSYKGATN